MVNSDLRAAPMATRSGGRLPSRARGAPIDKLPQRPTQAGSNAPGAECNARSTVDKICALSADYTLCLCDAWSVQIKLQLLEDSDLSTFAPFTLMRREGLRC